METVVFETGRHDSCLWYIFDWRFWWKSQFDGNFGLVSFRSAPPQHCTYLVSSCLGSFGIDYLMGLLPDTQNCGLRMHRECRERFSFHWLQRKPLVGDPGMQHGTCVTHVPWCMSGSLTRDGGENGGENVAKAKRLLTKSFLLKALFKSLLALVTEAPAADRLVIKRQIIDHINPDNHAHNSRYIVF